MICWPEINFIILYLTNKIINATLTNLIWPTDSVRKAMIFHRIIFGRLLRRQKFPLSSMWSDSTSFSSTSGCEFILTDKLTIIWRKKPRKMCKVKRETALKIAQDCVMRRDRESSANTRAHNVCNARALFLFPMVWGRNEEGKWRKHLKKARKRWNTEIDMQSHRPAIRGNGTLSMSENVGSDSRWRSRKGALADSP